MSIFCELGWDTGFGSKSGANMSKRIIAVSIFCAFAVLCPATSFATDSSSPAPSPLTSPSVHSLKKAQKDAIAAARIAFASAKENAQNGFDRAIADAQALRDQAITSAGADRSAVRRARMSYRDSYRAIANAYKADLKNARLALLKAIASVKGAKKGH